MAQGTHYHDGTGWKPTHDRPPLRRPVEGGDAALPEALRAALADYYTHVVPNFDDENGLAYINAVLAALGAELRQEGNTPDAPDVPEVPVDPRVFIADLPLDAYMVRANLTENNEAGAWSAEVPYTEGMTVTGCYYDPWAANYDIAVITAPDGTQQLSGTDVKGEVVYPAAGTKPEIYQYTAVLAGFPAGSTVRLNLYLGPTVTTEELARAFLDERRDLLYYIPGEGTA